MSKIERLVMNNESRGSWSNSYSGNADAWARYRDERFFYISGEITVCEKGTP